MRRYLARRLLLLLPVLVGVSVIIFMVLHLSPGDPAEIMLGSQATKEDLARLRADLGLTEPLHVQYVHWISHVVRGDLGRSLWMKRPVLGEVLTRLRATLLLTATALLLSTTVGVALGVAAATRPNSVLDRLSAVASLFGASMPSFWLGIVLMVIFALWLGWLPASGMYSPFGGGDLRDLLGHLILPAVTLGLAGGGWYSRMMRSSMVDVLRQDYIRTARAKGLDERSVLFVHAFRNAVLPIIAMIGLDVGIFMSGVVVVESVYGWPGIGQLMWQAIQDRDIPIIMGVTLTAAIFIVLGNLLADLIAPLIDPRIRLR